MNHWQTEHLAAYRRQQLLDEAEHIRLARLAGRYRGYRPGLYERTMFHFANWMIAAGKQLRKRYEAPAVPCSHSPSGSFAG